AEASPAARTKANRYRRLNESDLAESICEDILGSDPDDQQALVMLVLAITDQFGDHGAGARMARARALLPRLHDAYERTYYDGIICERFPRAHLAHGAPRGHRLPPHWFAKALPLLPRS